MWGGPINSFLIGRVTVSGPMLLQTLGPLPTDRNHSSESSSWWKLSRRLERSLSPILRYSPVE